MKFHPRNKHQGQYDLTLLAQAIPSLEQHLQKKEDGSTTISFADNQASRLVNKALMSVQYNIKVWNIPDKNLCPAVPGRADYVHLVADLLARYNDGKTPTGSSVKAIDIGTGPGIVFPLIAHEEYGWSFVASDIVEDSLACAQSIIDANKHLKNHIKIKMPKGQNNMFDGIIKEGDWYECTFCNPPFYESKKEAIKEAKRKMKRLTGEKVESMELAGISEELIFPGGEKAFIMQLIEESKGIGQSVYWFTSWVSKKENLKPLYAKLRAVKAEKVETIPMVQKNKSSRIIAWTFQTKDQRKRLAQRNIEV